jgi:hypothetical protein
MTTTANQTQVGAQYRIVDADSGRRLMDYNSRGHADAWLSSHPGYRVYSQHPDSPEQKLHAIYVENMQRHAISVEGRAA